MACRFFCRRLLLVEQVLDTLQGHAQPRGRRERFRDLVARYDHKDIFITARIPQQDRQAIAVMQDGAASAEHLLGVRVFIVAGGQVFLCPRRQEAAQGGENFFRRFLPVHPVQALPVPQGQSHQRNMPAGVGFFHVELFTKLGTLCRCRGGGVDLVRQRFGIGNTEQGKEREQGRARYGHRRRYPGPVRIQDALPACAPFWL